MEGEEGEEQQMQFENELNQEQANEILQNPELMNQLKMAYEQGMQNEENA